MKEKRKENNYNFWLQAAFNRFSRLGVLSEKEKKALTEAWWNMMKNTEKPEDTTADDHHR